MCVLKIGEQRIRKISFCRFSTFPLVRLFAEHPHLPTTCPEGDEICRGQDSEIFSDLVFLAMQGVLFYAVDQFALSHRCNVAVGLTWSNSQARPRCFSMSRSATTAAATKPACLVCHSHKTKCK